MLFFEWTGDLGMAKGARRTQIQSASASPGEEQHLLPLPPEQDGGTADERETEAGEENQKEQTGNRRQEKERV